MNLLVSIYFEITVDNIVIFLIDAYSKHKMHLVSAHEIVDWNITLPSPLSPYTQMF